MVPAPVTAGLFVPMACIAMAGCVSVPPPSWPAESTHYLYSSHSPARVLWPESVHEPESIGGLHAWLRSRGTDYVLGHTYAPDQLAVRLGPLTERGRDLVGEAHRSERDVHGVMVWGGEVAPTAYLFPVALEVEAASPTDFAIAYGDGEGAYRWRLWSLTSPASLGRSIRGPAATYADTRRWVAVTRDGTRAIVVDEALHVEDAHGEPMALPEAFTGVAVASVMPMLDATHVAVKVWDPRDPRGPRAYVWRPGDPEAFPIPSIVGADVAGARLDLLMASPNTIYRLSRDADHRPHARKVLSIPSYPRPASISPDETRMVSYRQQAYGKSYVYAVHQISDDGTRVSSTDGDQDVLDSYVVWLPHGLGAPSGVVVVPPPSGWDAASP